MSEVAAKITVAKVDGRVRTVVVFPDVLDVLSPNGQERVVENAMWRASEAVTAFVDRERVEGVSTPVVHEVRAA